MAAAAVALAFHLAAGPAAAARVASRPAHPVRVAAASRPTASEQRALWPSSEPATQAPPRGEFQAAFLVALGRPTTPGLALRGRVRLLAGLWAHAGVSARAGSAPADGGVREIPFELGLGYRVAIGQRLSLGLRGEALVMSRRMAVASAEPRHRWLAGLRGGAEARFTLTEQVGLTLLLGAEGRLGRTEVQIGPTRAVFSPIAPYVEVGPSLYF